MATTAADRLFVDTNILVRSTIPEAPLHQEARAVIAEFGGTGAELWISRQIIREYLAVLSRPQAFSPPLASVNLRRHVERFLRAFHVVDEDERVTEHLLQVLDRVPTGGKQVHDANIMATMLANGIPKLITHNVADFSRFATVIEVVPLA
jgi:predicted nucleic acid-binding protein